MFKGIEIYEKLWNEGYLIKEYSIIRLMWNVGRGDEHFLVLDKYELEGIQCPGHPGREEEFTIQEKFY